MTDAAMRADRMVDTVNRWLLRGARAADAAQGHRIPDGARATVPGGSGARGPA